MIKKEEFDESQPIKITPYLMDICIACNNTDVHEEAAVWLVPCFLQLYQELLASPAEPAGGYAPL